MRDYSYFDQYYEELLGDIYPQPPDEWHTEEMKKVIKNWIAPLHVNSVLDVGCGQGEAQKFFEDAGVLYLGIGLSSDIDVAKGKMVSSIDFNFLGESQQDLIFSRHSLEHSPFPLLTLMEWHRISRRWLCLVVPNPKYFTFIGRNHYSVADQHQVNWWLRRAGWKLVKFNGNDMELKFLCEKRPRISHEGWIRPPIGHLLYKFERDELEINRGDVSYSENVLESLREFL